MVDVDEVVAAWLAFQERTGGFLQPETEMHYQQLLKQIRELEVRPDARHEPVASLLQFTRELARTWEVKRVPKLVN